MHNEGRRSPRQAMVLTVAVIATIAVLLDTRWQPPGTRPSAALVPASTQATTAPTLVRPPSTPSSEPATSRPAATVSPSATPLRTPALQHAAALRSIADLTRGLPPGSYSIAALNMATGASYAAGARSGMWTASAYKLFLLEIMLSRAGGPLQGSAADEATSMIENSDNVAGYDAFEDVGDRSGYAAGLQSLGLRNTVAGYSDPTFTTSSAMDGITLLKNLVRPGRLSTSARAYAVGLMQRVESDQRWGVGVDADAGTDFANKNGWLSIDDSNGPGEDDDGRWAVTSFGVITVKGQQVLMAVMTRHDPDVESGVRLVESLARAMKPLISS